MKCVIRGSRGNVTIADSLVQKFIMEHLVLYEEPLLVPSAAVGRIIGKGGETIRSIQEVSKARVMVDTRNKPGTNWITEMLLTAYNTSNI